MAATCVQQHNWVSEYLVQMTLQHSLKVVYQVVNPAKEDQEDINL